MRKFLKWSLGTLAVLLVLAIILPFLFKGKIVGLIKSEANKSLHATLAFNDDISLSLITSFPNFSIGIKDLSIANKGQFEGDTLLSTKEFEATVDLMSVISGDQINIKTIYLSQPRIHAIILKDGKANWDIAMPDSAAKPEDTAASSFKASLKKLTIDDGYLVYDDRQLGFYTKAVSMNHTLSGDFTQDMFLLSTQTEIGALTLGYGGVNYLNAVKTKAIADLDMDMKNFKFTFKENKFDLNDLQLGLNGWLAMPGDDMDMDLNIDCKQTSFKNILSLLPGVYTKDFAQVKTSGTMGLKAHVKGIYNDKRMPAFGLDLNVAQGYFAYPSMPSAVSNITINLAVSNPDGVPDHTYINLAKLHADIGSNPLDAKVIVKTPVSDADIDAVVKGRINLAELTKIIPQEAGTELSGIINSDIEAKGKLSAIANKKYELFYAKGNVGAAQLHYKSKDFAQGVDISKMNMNFTPATVELSQCDLRIGASDLAATGKLDNVLGYIFSDQTLGGTLNLQSNYFNCNQFLSSNTTDNKAPKPQDTVPLTAIALPANIHFLMNAKFNELLYDNLLMKNMKGALLLADQKLNLTGLTMDLFNGNLALDGLYNAANINKPVMDLKLKINQMDIGQVTKYFASFKKWAPIAEYITGSFSTSLGTTEHPLQLDEHLKPILPSLSALGTFEMPSFKVAGYQPLSLLASTLNKPEYQQLTIQKVKGMFEIKDGRIYIKPFDFKMDKAKATLSGSNGIDQTMDYKMKLDVPRNELGQGDVAIQNLLNQAESKGVKLKLPETLPVSILMGGTVKKPTIKTDLSEVKKQLVDDIKRQLLGLFDQKKQELQDAAKKEADKAKQQAEQRIRDEADKAKQKTQAEADRLKKEAEDKAKQEADKAKQKGKEELKKGLDGLFRKK
jgi:hypothetical protein